MGYTSNWQNRTLHTPSLRWLADLLSYLAPDSVIKIPTDYREKVKKVKELLESDVSGLVNSLLDFAIGCAVTNFRIEADCLLYTSPSPRDVEESRMPSSA